MFVRTLKHIFIPVILFAFIISQIHGKLKDYETYANKRPVGHSRLSFCLDDSMIYTFSTRECPGGIRFKEDAQQPMGNCYCVDGTFIGTGDEFGTDYTVVSAKGNKCFKFNNTNVLKRNEAEICEEDAAYFKWSLVSLTDTNNYNEDFVALWTDPAQAGDLKQFRHYKLNTQFNENAVFGSSDSWTGKVAIIRGKNSQLANVKLGNKCFVADQKAQVFIYNETVLSKGQYFVTTIECDGQGTVEATQILARVPNQDQICSLPDTCVEFEGTYARIATPWASLSEAEKLNDYYQANRELVEYRIRMEEQGAHVTASMSQRLQILNMSQKVFQKAGSNLIHPSIIETAFRLFQYIYHDIDVVEELHPSDFKQIIYFIGQCAYATEEINYSTTGCPPKAQTYTNNGTRGSSNTLSTGSVPFDKSKIPDKIKFDVSKNDPIVDLMWKTVDFVYSTCFTDFDYNTNLLSYFHEQMLQLFLLPQVQYRWFRTTTTGMALYGPIIPRLTQEIMENADFIAGSVHDLDGDFAEDWIEKPNAAVLKDTDESSNGNKTAPFREYEIWGGIAYCLQLKDFNIGVDAIENENSGLIPSLGDINSALDNGPGRCK